jgi:hypothetical protein
MIAAPETVATVKTPVTHATFRGYRNQMPRMECAVRAPLAKRPIVDGSSLSIQCYAHLTGRNDAPKGGGS